MEWLGIQENPISTHSLTKRLTFHQLHHNDNFQYFNSQPHEEADAEAFAVSIDGGNFNSQPHEEADKQLGIC